MLFAVYVEATEENSKAAWFNEFILLIHLFFTT